MAKRIFTETIKKLHGGRIIFYEEEEKGAVRVTIIVASKNLEV